MAGNFFAFGTFFCLSMSAAGPEPHRRQRLVSLAGKVCYVVFAVFHKHPGGRLEWIGGAETEERARLMARMWSRYGNTEVVVVENGDNGRTQHRATFFQGHFQGLPNQPNPPGSGQAGSGEYADDLKH